MTSKNSPLLSIAIPRTLLRLRLLISVLPFWLLLTGALIGEELVTTDFGHATEPIVDQMGNPNSMVRGWLPRGWREDSSGWCQLRARTELIKEEGRSMLRVTTEEIVSGRLQFCFHPLPPSAEKEVYYHLEMEVRNHNAGLIMIGLRQVRSPYQFLWSGNILPSEDMQRLDVIYQPECHPGAIGLWITAQAGKFDLGSLRLRRYSREQMLSHLRQRLPTDGSAAQLFPQNRLPLGLAAGWSLNNESSDDVVEVVGDPAAPGPTGWPSLRLRSPQPVTLVSAPFRVIDLALKHRVQIAMRGSGDWSVHVLANNSLLANRRLEPRDVWSVADLEFTPMLAEAVHVIRFAGHGELWIDDLRAGPADGLSDIPTRPEIALALGGGDAALAGIFFPDETPILKYLATGVGEEETLHLSITDLYGTSTLLPLNFLDGTEGEQPLAELLTDRLGSFRINAWVERAGVIRSPVAERVIHRLPRPRCWGKNAPDSPFGVHTFSTLRHCLMAKSIGINWVRLHDAGLEYIGWWNLEPQRGQWRFFDGELRRYRSHQLLILGELGTAPPWGSYYSQSGRTDFGYWDKFFQPLDLADYRNYVRTVVQRYQGIIEAWDVWNEPWGHAWWAVAFDADRARASGIKAGYVTSDEPQRDFVAMMAAAHAEVRAQGSNAPVLGFNTNASGGEGGKTSFSGTQWTAGVLAHSGLDHCDVLAYHHYTDGEVGYPDDSVGRGLELALGATRTGEGRLPKRVWMTEGSSVNNIVGSGLHLHALAGTDPDLYRFAAEREVRYMLSLLANGVERIFLYSMHSHWGYHRRQREWATLVTPDGQLHPTGVAHAIFAWHVEGLSFSSVTELGGGAFAYAFTGERTVIVISSDPSYRSGVTVPAQVKARDLWGNPLEAGTNFTGSPIYLTTTLPVSSAMALLKRKTEK